MAKAFDSVVHTKDVLKLKACGIADNLLRWFEAFRFQCESIEGVNSCFLPVKSGVIQGSVIGPLLFTIYINDLTNYLKGCNVIPPNPADNNYSANETKLYADDLKLYSVVHSKFGGGTLQNAIGRISDWCNAWQLKINLKKSGVMHLGKNNMNYVYYLNGEVLQSFTSVSDLGIEVDQSLNFKTHIEAIVRKARARCSMFF